MAEWKSGDMDTGGTMARLEQIALDAATKATPNARVVELAWRDGWKCCRDSLTEDEAFCLTEDVEADAWADCETRAALSNKG